MQEQRRGRKIAMTDEELDAYLGTERTCTVATVSHDGPHVTALWFVWDGECVWLYSITRSQRWTDLQRDPRVAVLVEAGEEYNELRGVRDPRPRRGRRRRTAYGWSRRRRSPTPEGLFAAKYQGGGDEMFHDGRHAWLSSPPRRSRAGTSASSVCDGSPNVKVPRSCNPGVEPATND